MEVTDTQGGVDLDEEIRQLSTRYNMLLTRNHFGFVPEIRFSTMAIKYIIIVVGVFNRETEIFGQVLFSSIV